MKQDKKTKKQTKQLKNSKMKPHVKEDLIAGGLILFCFCFSMGLWSGLFSLNFGFGGHSAVARELIAKYLPNNEIDQANLEPCLVDFARTSWVPLYDLAPKDWAEISSSPKTEAFRLIDQQYPKEVHQILLEKYLELISNDSFRKTGEEYHFQKNNKFKDAYRYAYMLSLSSEHQEMVNKEKAAFAGKIQQFLKYKDLGDKRQEGQSLSKNPYIGKFAVIDNSTGELHDFHFLLPETIRAKTPEEVQTVIFGKGYQQHTSRFGGFDLLVVEFRAFDIRDRENPLFLASNRVAGNEYGWIVGRKAAGDEKSYKSSKKLSDSFLSLAPSAICYRFKPLLDLTNRQIIAKNRDVIEKEKILVERKQQEEIRIKKEQEEKEIAFKKEKLDAEKELARTNTRITEINKQFYQNEKEVENKKNEDASVSNNATKSEKVKVKKAKPEEDPLSCLTKGRLLKGELKGGGKNYKVRLKIGKEEGPDLKGLLTLEKYFTYPSGGYVFKAKQKPKYRKWGITFTVMIIPKGKYFELRLIDVKKSKKGPYDLPKGTKMSGSTALVGYDVKEKVISGNLTLDKTIQ